MIAHASRRWWRSRRSAAASGRAGAAAARRAAASGSASWVASGVPVSRCSSRADADAAIPSCHRAARLRIAPAVRRRAPRSGSSQAPDQASCSSVPRRAGDARRARRGSEGPAALALGHELAHLRLGRVLDVAEAEAHARALGPCTAPREAFTSSPSTSMPRCSRLVHEAVGGVEAHRLLVQQRAQELRAVVDAQPRRLVGEQAEGGAVGLGEAEAGEALDHLHTRSAV